MRYIQVIEELSNSKYLHQGDIDNFSKEILEIAANTLGCQRTNAWLFNKDKSILRSINAFDTLNATFSIEKELRRTDLPKYFNFLIQNRIIVSVDANSSEMNEELLESYILPNQIKSMIDVPLRSEGKMIGVICFECVNKAYQWTDSDQKFAQSLAQLFSLAYETNQKNIYRIELEKTIAQKEVLLSEINHRVKNNMSVIIGLINLQKTKSKDEYHEDVLEGLKQKIYSMALVQNHLHNNKSLVRVDLSMYLREVIQNLHNSYSQNNEIELNLRLDKMVIDISKGIPIGLIANEVLTNSFKYAYNGQKSLKKMDVIVKREKNKVDITFKDNGPGYNPKNTQEGMGMELIRDLTGQIDGSLQIHTTNGVEIGISFPLENN